MIELVVFKSFLKEGFFNNFLDLDIAEIKPKAGFVSVKIQHRKEFSRMPGANDFHGGIIASVLDITGTMACTLATGFPTPTVDFRVDYLKNPGPITLFSKGKVLRSGRTIATADIELVDEEGRLYATARGTWSTAGAAQSAKKMRSSEK